jgi:excisionase family DNA binding protein
MKTQIFLNGITLEQLAEALAPLLMQPQCVELIQPFNEYIKREEACELLSINLSSLWKHTKSGKLKSYGIGNRVLYKRSEVLDAVNPINH